MNIHEALAATILRDAEVVAGRQGLARPISWVHMVDHPDMQNWIKPGHLLLSTGYNWPKNDVDAEALVRALHAGGLAGVVLAVPRFIEHFSPAALAAADELGLPLLELAWDIPFSAVTEELNTLLIRSKSQEIARIEEIHIALTNAAVTAHSLNDLAEALDGILTRDITFIDQEGMLLGSSRESPNAREDERNYVVALHQTGGLRRILDSVSAVVIEPVDGKPRRLGCPVRIGGGLVAIIWLTEDETPLCELDSRAIEHAALIAALHISHQRALHSQEERLGYAFVGSLLEGRFDDTPSARNRATINGWNPDGHYRICLILLDEPLPLSRDGMLRLERLVQRLRQYLDQINEPALLFVSLNQITFLLSDKHGLEPLWKELGSKGAAMGVSRLHRGAAGMALGGADVQSLVDLLKPGRIHQFDEVMFPQALLGDANARAMLIEKRLGPLRGEKAEALLDTLEVLCQEGFQLAGTSRRLGVHISTLRYRLERIESALGVSLENQALRFELQVAVALMRLTE